MLVIAFCDHELPRLLAQNAPTNTAGAVRSPNGDFASWKHALPSAMHFVDLFAETHVFGIALHPWKIVGLSGSIVFGLRFIIQWIASEKARKSVIPFGFWECSAVGSILTLSYFALYQRDSVGVLMTAMPLPIYLRNLYFRYSHRHPKHPGNEPRPAE